MTPTELQKLAKQNETTCANTFPNMGYGYLAMSLFLILYGIKLLGGGNSIDNT